MTRDKKKSPMQQKGDGEGKAEQGKAKKDVAIPLR